MSRGMDTVLTANVGAVNVRIGIVVSAADVAQANAVLAVLRAYIGDLLLRADGMIAERDKGN